MKVVSRVACLAGRLAEMKEYMMAAAKAERLVRQRVEG